MIDVGFFSKFKLDNIHNQTINWFDNFEQLKSIKISHKQI